MGATDLPYWEAQGQMAKYGIYCDPCTLQGEYEHWYEQGDGAEEERGRNYFGMLVTLGTGGGNVTHLYEGYLCAL